MSWPACSSTPRSQSVGVGHAQHAVEMGAGDARGNGNRDAGRGAGRDRCRFGPDVVRHAVRRRDAVAASRSTWLCAASACARATASLCALPPSAVILPEALITPSSPKRLIDVLGHFRAPRCVRSSGRPRTPRAARSIASRCASRLRVLDFARFVAYVEDRDVRRRADGQRAEAAFVEVRACGRRCGHGAHDVRQRHSKRQQFAHGARQRNGVAVDVAGVQIARNRMHRHALFERAFAGSEAERRLRRGRCRPTRRVRPRREMPAAPCPCTSARRRPCRDTLCVMMSPGRSRSSTSSMTGGALPMCSISGSIRPVRRPCAPSSRPARRTLRCATPTPAL